MDAETTKFAIWLAQGLLTLLVAILWFFFQEVRRDTRSNTKALNEANKELQDYKLYVANNHPHNRHLDDAMAKSNGSFDALFKELRDLRADISNMGNVFRDRLNEKQDRA